MKKADPNSSRPVADFVLKKAPGHSGFWWGWLAIMLVGFAGWWFRGKGNPSSEYVPPATVAKIVPKTKPPVLQPLADEPDVRQPHPTMALGKQSRPTPPPIPPVSSAIGVVNGQPHPPTMTTTGLPSPEELAAMEAPPEVIAARSQPPPPGVLEAGKSPPPGALEGLRNPAPGVPPAGPLPGVPLAPPPSK
jgi:hypothetical protein